MSEENDRNAQNENMPSTSSEGLQSLPLLVGLWAIKIPAVNFLFTLFVVAHVSYVYWTLTISVWVHLLVMVWIVLACAAWTELVLVLSAYFQRKRYPVLWTNAQKILKGEALLTVITSMGFAVSAAIVGIFCYPYWFSF